jgi:hypothetical protein
MVMSERKLKLTVHYAKGHSQFKGALSMPPGYPLLLVYLPDKSGIRKMIFPAEKHVSQTDKRFTGGKEAYLPVTGLFRLLASCTVDTRRGWLENVFTDGKAGLPSRCPL